MKNIFASFFSAGEKIDGYDVLVLNEREVRAAAGILFLFSFIVFFQAFLLGNFFYAQIFISFFVVDFALRLINPAFSPTLIVGKFAVSKQKVEYTGAPQKRFAWALGLFLSSFVFVTLVLLGQQGPLQCFLCLICLILLFLETSFGICVGCALYNLFHKEKAHFCPGGVCEIHRKEPIQKISKLQILIVLLFIIGIFVSANTVFAQKNIAKPSMPDFSASSESSGNGICPFKKCGKFSADTTNHSPYFSQ